MKLVAVSQRVGFARHRAERRDALDQRWSRFLGVSGLLPLPVPNNVAAARELIAAVPLAGVVLTGGNDLGAYGGDAPERDATELALIEWALATGRPLIGVCRGMQILQHYYGIKLVPVQGHVMPRQQITVQGRREFSNSYHTFGASTSVADLEVWAVADDGIVKAVRHRTRPVLAVMWHPERFDPFRTADIDLFRAHFGAEATG